MDRLWYWWCALAGIAGVLQVFANLYRNGPLVFPVKHAALTSIRERSKHAGKVLQDSGRLPYPCGEDKVIYSTWQSTRTRWIADGVSASEAAV